MMPKSPRVEPRPRKLEPLNLEIKAPQNDGDDGPDSGNHSIPTSTRNKGSPSKGSPNLSPAKLPPLGRPPSFARTPPLLTPQSSFLLTHNQNSFRTRPGALSTQSSFCLPAGEGPWELQRSQSRMELGRRISVPKRVAVVPVTWPQKLNRFMESKLMMFVMFGATIWALFGADLSGMFKPPKELDNVVLSITFGVLLVFTFEWAVLTFVAFGYRFSFFFWLDLIAWLSLVPDAYELFESAIGSKPAVLSSGTLTLARAGRAARAGTRAARIVRIFKLLSLMKKKKENATKNKVLPEDEIPDESKIGARLADGITQKVIVIVALMLIVTSLLELLTVTENSTWMLQVKMWDVLWEHIGRPGTAPTPGCGEGFSPCACFLYTYIQDHPLLLFLQVNNTILYPVGAQDNSSYSHFRVDDIITATSQNGASVLVIDGTDATVQTHITNFLQMVFIVVLLGTISWLFSRDTQSLVIGPIEKMSTLVRKLADDPLSNIEDAESGAMETDFVEMAMRRFVKLVQVAFGEAGANIIKKNLATDGALDALVPGSQMRGVFGFCDIRNFTDCTECLQDQVMLFVNRIAEYVHWAVKIYGGAPNKNIGDAFLLAWRLPANAHAPTEAGDNALKSFIKIINETSSCADLKTMTDNPSIQARIPGYSVRMGFGLHVGWAIEGAIGSVLKIDASYLSPHVNMAARLEAATKQFGVTILMTDQFVAILSPRVRSLCRQIDCVTVKGSTQPIGLWTYDVLPRTVDVSRYKEEPVGEFWVDNAPRTSKAHRENFKIALKAYVNGDWVKSVQYLDVCLNLDPQDHPARCLKNVMATMGTKGEAPAGWPGYRELTEK